MQDKNCPGKVLEIDSDMTVKQIEDLMKKYFPGVPEKMLEIIPTKDGILVRKRQRIGQVL